MLPFSGQESQHQPATMNMNVFAAQGSKKLHTLLTGLATMFPEREELGAWICIFENTVQGVPAMEESLMRRWHKEMTTNPDGSKREPNLYEKTRERDIEYLLSSGVWVLDELDVRSMFYDPDVLDEDRETICQHLDKINTCAEAMSAVPADMMKSIMSVASTIDYSQPMTNDTIFSVLQKIIGCRPEDLADDTDAMERLTGWSQHLMESISGGGMAALQSMTADASAEFGAPMPDMGALAAMMRSKLMGMSEGGDEGGEGGGDDGAGAFSMDMLATLMAGASVLP
jgi:hypothetical protein